MRERERERERERDRDFVCRRVCVWVREREREKARDGIKTKWHHVQTDRQRQKMDSIKVFSSSTFLLPKTWKEAKET